MNTGFISRSSSTKTDPLSNVLSLLKPHAYKSVALDAGGHWALRLGQTDGFLCLVLVSGHCWLIVDGLGEPILLKAGEYAVLPKAPAFRIASDVSVPAVEFATVITDWPKDGVFTWQGGGACLLLSAFFTFASEHSEFLSLVLPPILHLDTSGDCAALRWYLERMMAVIRNPQPGSVLQGEYLAQLMLLEILQLHATGAIGRQVGWLSALANPQLGSAITRMHEHPGHRWTVQELAERAGMSRSAFAERFKEQTGTAVMEYLIRWRMLLAADRLQDSSEAVATIALSLGYKSESAFTFAFRREMGCSPRKYLRKRHSPSIVTDLPNSETGV
jgi:AraC-like DNA-binding protein